MLFSASEFIYLFIIVFVLFYFLHYAVFDYGEIELDVENNFLNVSQSLWLSILGSI